MSRSLERYSAALSTLEEARPQPSAEQILAVLNARDAIYVALAGGTLHEVEGLSRILQLDSRLKVQTARIGQAANLSDWRASFAPSAVVCRPEWADGWVAAILGDPIGASHTR